MTLLMLAAAQGGLPVTYSVEFRVGVNGAPPSAVVPPFGIPANATRIEVSAVPSNGAVWPVSATYTVSSDGSLSRTGPTPGFAEPLPALGTVTLVALLSRLRDATTSSVQGLQAVVTDPAVANALGFGARRADAVPQSWRQPDGTIAPPNDYDAPALDRISTLCLPPYDAMGPRTALRYVNPDSTTRILELTGDPVPRLLGVSWANDLLADGARPLPFLLYFHHAIGQEVPHGFWTGPAGAYPFGYDPSMYGLWRYLQMGGDPANDSLGEKGIAFQVEAAGRSLVSVVPLNRVGSEVGRAVQAGWVREVLHEVQQFIHAWEGLPVAPAGIDRLAVAGFSSGNSFTAQLVQSALTDRAFAENILQEAYFFDPPANLHDVCVSAGTAFARQTISAKRVRFYVQTPPAGLASLIPSPTMPSPRVRSDASGRRTCIDFPVLAWKSWLEERGWTGPDWRTMHQLIAGLGLVDALRRSDFTRRGSRERGWRRCRRCQALFDSGYESVCPVGGGHDESGSAAYEVRFEEGDPACQPGWRWCNRCQGLYLWIRPAASRCPAGGAHDGTIGPEYEVATTATSADEEPGWRCCSRCQGLWYIGGPGVCPAGGAHDAIPSLAYAVSVG